MNLISKDKVFSLHPLPDGFIYSYLIERQEDIYTVGYKMVSFETGKISGVTKSIYMLTKFGADYKSFVGNLKNYLTCFCIPLEDSNTFVIEADGSATLYSTGGGKVWEGNMLYQNTAPGGIAVNQGSLWVSYPEHSALIRYDLKTLRQELRIGGSNSPFGMATNLFPAGSKLMICSKDTNSIIKLDCGSYQTETYYQFDEPINDYKLIGKHEIVVLASGIYLL